VGLVDQRFLGRHEVGLVVVVAEAIGDRPQRFERGPIGPLFERIHPPWREGHGDGHAAVLCRFLDGSAAGEHDQVRHGDLFAAAGRGVERVLDLADFLQHAIQQGRVVDLPILLRREADTSTVGAAALVRSAIGGGRSPGYRHQLGHGKAHTEQLLLQRGDVRLVDHRVIALWNRVLPDQLFLRHQWPEVAADGTHVAVGELEPRLGEGIGELVRVLEEVTGDLFVLRIETQRQVRGKHGWLALLVRVEGVGNDFPHVLCDPLMRASRALGQLPFEVEQVLEEVVGPLRRGLTPDDFQARGNGVCTGTGLESAAPTQALVFDQGAFRVWPQ